MTVLVLPYYTYLYLAFFSQTSKPIQLAYLSRFGRYRGRMRVTECHVKNCSVIFNTKAADCAVYSNCLLVHTHHTLHSLHCHRNQTHQFRWYADISQGIIQAKSESAVLSGLEVNKDMVCSYPMNSGFPSIVRREKNCLLQIVFRVLSFWYMT